MTDGLMRVELFTRDGGFVVAGVLPPFGEPPEVLFWGARVFRHDHDGRYVEAFAFALLPQHETTAGR
jgi:hypothetical protein